MINWRWPTSHCQPIGLDIGSSSIKMIQLAVSGEQVRIIAADKIRIDHDVNKDEWFRKSFIVSAIKQMLAENNFLGRNVVSHLPNDDVKITSLRMAEEQGDKIEQALRKEAAVRFGMEPDKDMVDYIVAGAVQQGDEVKNELIVFAATDEAVREHIKMLEEAKLRPVSIDAVPCALFRSSGRFLRRHEDKERTVVFIDIGSRYTSVVFGREGQISFVKQIAIGTEKFGRQIASKLGINFKDAEMLRGALRVEQLNMNQAMLGTSPVLDNCVQAVNGENSLQRESEQAVSTKAASAEPPAQGGTGLDAVTRQAMTDAISSVAEELSREVSLCLRYYTVTFRGKHIERVIATGGGAYEKILIETVRQRLGAEIEIGQPLRGFDLAEVRFDKCNHNQLCEWAVAAGLSLKGSEPLVSMAEHRTARQTGKRIFDKEDNYERN